MSTERSVFLSLAAAVTVALLVTGLAGCGFDNDHSEGDKIQNPAGGGGVLDLKTSLDRLWRGLFFFGFYRGDDLFGHLVDFRL